jgi:DNA-binding MarR family transcriptional regulator
MSREKISIARMQAADRLHSAAIHLLRKVSLEDKRSGVGPAQLSALSVLVFAGPKSLGELAEAERVRPATMSRVVAGMRRAGLARTVLARDDRRRLKIAATSKGSRILQAARQRRVQNIAVALAPLTSAELKKVRSLAELILEIVQKL